MEHPIDLLKPAASYPKAQPMEHPTELETANLKARPMSYLTSFQRTYPAL
jgi:hypothetical protein